MVIYLIKHFSIPARWMVFLVRKNLKCVITRTLPTRTYFLFICTVFLNEWKWDRKNAVNLRPQSGHTHQIWFMTRWRWKKEYPHTKLVTKILTKPYSCVHELQFTKPFSPWTYLCVYIYYKGVTSHLRANIKIKIYRTKILSVVLYRCEPWSLILTEKPKLRVVEDRMLRKIFRPKMDEVTGEWRGLHNEELHDV